MSDEAVVRIVLEGDEGSSHAPPALSVPEQRQQSAALLRGDAMPWAPPNKPIQAPVLEGMRRDQAEYLRLESEAARRGMSVKDYKKAEVDAKSSAIPPEQPSKPPPPPPVDRTGLATAGAGMASAIVGNLYDGLFDALKQGKDKFAGVRDPVLAKAKASFDQGLINSAKDLQNLAQAGFDPHLAGLSQTRPIPAQVQVAPDPDSDEEIARRRKEREDARNKRLGEFATNEQDFYKEYKQPPPSQPAAPPSHESGTAGPEVTYDFAWVSPRTRERLEREKEEKDNLDLAKKRVKREEKRAAVDAEYAKLKPPPPPTADPPFDPIALAKKRVEAEKKRAAVDVEYAKLKPKSATDSLLDLAQSIRGTLGGTLGTVVGAGLDIVSNVRKNKTTEAAAGGEDVGDAATEAGSSLAALVPVVGTTIAVVGGLTKVFTTLLGVANEMATRYGEYNPEIAQAQATAEIRQIMGDMRRSQENSREIAELIEAQSEMQQKWEDIKVAAMSKIIPVLTGVLEVLGSLLGIASRPEMKEIEDPTEAILGRKMGGLGSTEMIPDV